MPNFLRSWLNQYATIILPDAGYVFREHTIGGPPDKIFEEAAFLERFRDMLVMEEGASLWLARATPRAWLQQGRKISVKNAPSHFGTVAYEIVSDVDHGRITATVEMPSRQVPKTILLRLRHPEGKPIHSVTVNGREWESVNRDKETIELKGLRGEIAVQANYATGFGAAQQRGSRPVTSGTREATLKIGDKMPAIDVKLTGEGGKR